MKEYIFRLQSELGVEVVYFDVKKMIFLSEDLQGKINDAIKNKELTEIIINNKELREFYDVVETPEGYYENYTPLDHETIFNMEKERCSELGWVSALAVIFVCSEK